MSGDARFYVQCSVLAIAVVGTIANGLVLYAMMASKQHKKHMLIVHQNALDFLASLFLMITYSMKFHHIYLSGPAGHMLCILLVSDALPGWMTNTSVINLAGITVERYLKVVHPVWSKNKLRNWMEYLAMVVTYIPSFMALILTCSLTTVVRDGVCYAYTVWRHESARLVFFLWNVISFYVLILIIFIFCYWRILLVIRRQAKTMASHGGHGSSTAHTQSNQIQTNVIKTMIIVCTLYAVCYFTGLRRVHASIPESTIVTA